jgi:hypothetical protein
MKITTDTIELIKKSWISIPGKGRMFLFNHDQNPRTEWGTKLPVYECNYLTPIISSTFACNLECDFNAGYLITF